MYQALAPNRRASAIRVAGIFFVLILANIQANAASTDHPKKYAVKCVAVPAEDVELLDAPFIVAGSNPPATQMFALHALITWRAPELSSTANTLTFSVTIANAYLVKVEPHAQAQQRTADEMSMATLNDPTRKVPAHRYEYSPAMPVTLTTEIRWPRIKFNTFIKTYDSPNIHSDDVDFLYTPGIGESNFRSNGFALQVKAIKTPGNYGFEYSVKFDGPFTLDGVTYKSSDPIEATRYLGFGIKLVPIEGR